MQKIATAGESLKSAGDKVSSAGEKLLPASAAVTALALGEYRWLCCKKIKNSFLQQGLFFVPSVSFCWENHGRPFLLLSLSLKV